MGKERWYRTGAVAEETGISQYKLRALAKEGLIESRSSNGMLYIAGSTVERLKTDGPPAMPARARAVEDEPELPASDDEPEYAQADGDRERSTHRAIASTRLTQELYAAPSLQLAKSKEKVIRLQHTVEAKRLQQQSREIDAAAREDRARQHEHKRVREWRDGNIRRVVEKVPGESCAATCARVEELLNRVPLGSNVTAKVDEIIQLALRPTKRREDQARAVEHAILQLRPGARRSEWEDRARSEAMNVILQLPEHAGYVDMQSAARAIIVTLNAAFDHAARIEQAVAWLGFSLPSGGSPDDREEAQHLASGALRGLPPGASDRQFKSTLQNAIAPVVSRIESKRAQEERDRQERAHRSRIDSTVSHVYLSLDATSEEYATARRRVRAALEQLPPTASDREVDAAKEKQLAPIKAAIQAREHAERKADSALSSVEEYLREYFDFDSPHDVYIESRELKDVCGRS